MLNMDCILQAPKHTCGDILRLNSVVLKRINVKESIDYGNISYCENCDKFVYIESKPFGKLGGYLELFPEEREFLTIEEVEKFLEVNELESI
jgi:hypothetical protein